MNNGDPFGYLVIIAIIGFCIWFFGGSVFSDEISIYPQEYVCSGDNERKNCKWRNLPSRTFKPIVGTQIVLTWTSKDQWPISKYDNCIVASKKQWSCGESYIFGIKGGEFISPFEGEKIRYVSKLSWWADR